MAGGLKAHTNPYLEAWATNREHIERTFRWTPRTLAVVAVAGVLVPTVIYKIGVAEYVRYTRAPATMADGTRVRVETHVCAVL